MIINKTTSFDKMIVSKVYRYTSPPPEFLFLVTDKDEIFMHGVSFYNNYFEIEKKLKGKYYLRLIKKLSIPDKERIFNTIFGSKE